MKDKKDLEIEFIQKAKNKWGDKFNYSKVNYINNKTDVWIYCNECKKWFKQAPTHHLRNIHGCPYCALRSISEKNRSTKDKFINLAEKAHGKGAFDYSKVIYINRFTEVIIIDNETKQEFSITPERFLRGNGNPLKSGSSGEQLIKSWLFNYQKANPNIKYEQEYCIKGEIKGRTSNKVKIDFRITDKNTDKEIWIEYNGGYHYKPVFSWGDWENKFKNQLERDLHVRGYCDKKDNITLIEIPYKYYHTYDTIDELLNSIFIDKNDPKDIIKPLKIKYLPSKLSDKDLSYINHLISLLNKENINKNIEDNDNEVKENEDNINKYIINSILKYYTIGTEIIRVSSVGEVIDKIFKSINYKRKGSANYLDNFFIVKRRSIREEVDGKIKRVGYLRIADIKPEYKYLIQPT